MGERVKDVYVMRDMKDVYVMGERGYLCLLYTSDAADD